MRHGKMNRVVLSTAGLAIIAAAAVACSNSPSTAGKGGDLGTTSSTQASQVASLLQTGIKQADQEQWSAATSTFDKVLAINSNNVYADYDLGVIAQNTGNPNQAISDYNKALTADTVYTPAMYNEAILLESSQPQQAIAIYQKIVSIDPRAATAYLRMAVVQAEQGDLTEAKANDAKAVSLDSALSKYSLPAKQ